MQLSKLLVLSLLLSAMLTGNIVVADDTSATTKVGAEYLALGGDSLTPCDDGNTCYMWYWGYCIYIC